MKDYIYKYRPEFVPRVQNKVGQQLTFYDRFKKEYNWEAQLQGLIQEKQENLRISEFSQELSSLRNCNPNYLNFDSNYKSITPKQSNLQQSQFKVSQTEDLWNLNVQMKQKLEQNRQKIENDNKSLSSLEIKTKSKSPQNQYQYSKFREQSISNQNSLKRNFIKKTDKSIKKNLTEKKGKSLSNQKRKIEQQNYNSNKKRKTEPENFTAQKKIIQARENNKVSDLLDLCWSKLKNLSFKIKKSNFQNHFSEILKNFEDLRNQILYNSQLLSEQSPKATDRENYLIKEIFQLCAQNSQDDLNTQNLSQFQQLLQIKNFLIQNPKEFSFKALPKSLTDQYVQTDFQNTLTSIENIQDQKDQIKELNLVIKQMHQEMLQSSQQNQELTQKFQNLFEVNEQSKIQIQNYDQKVKSFINEKNKILELNNQLAEQLKENEKAICQARQNFNQRESHYQKQIQILEKEKEELNKEYNKIKYLLNENEDKKSLNDLMSEQMERSEIENYKIHKSEIYDREASLQSEEDQQQVEQIVIQLINANKTLNEKFDLEKKDLQEKIDSLNQQNNELKIKIKKYQIDSKVHNLIKQERNQYKQQLDQISSNQNQVKKDENIYHKENKLLFDEMMEQKNAYQKILEEKQSLMQDMKIIKNENDIMKKLIDNFEQRLDIANSQINGNSQDRLKETLLKLEKALNQNENLQKQIQELQEYEQQYKELKNQNLGLKEDLQNRKEIEKILQSEISELRNQLNKKDDQIENLIEELNKNFSQIPLKNSPQNNQPEIPIPQRKQISISINEEFDEQLDQSLISDHEKQNQVSYNQDSQENKTSIDYHKDPSIEEELIIHISKSQSDQKTTDNSSEKNKFS